MKAISWFLLSIQVKYDPHDIVNWYHIFLLFDFKRITIVLVIGLIIECGKSNVCKYAYVNY